MTSQEDVARRFAQGYDAENIPSASNFRAESTPDHDEFEAVILGHGWAALAARRPDGSVVEFHGWRGYSSSTSTQHGKMRRVFRTILTDNCIEESDGKPQYKANSLNWRVQQSGASEL